MKKYIKVVIFIGIFLLLGIIFYSSKSDILIESNALESRAYVVKSYDETVSVTFNGGDHNELFDDVSITLEIDENTGYVILPESFSSTVDIKGGTYLEQVDEETYYFDDDSGYSYTFTGWMLEGATSYYPDETVFQPGDKVSVDVIDVDGDGCVTLVAVWGKVIYLRNAYEDMYYTDYWILDLDTTSSSYATTGAWNYKYENDTLILNKGNDYNNPVSSLDYAYYLLYLSNTQRDNSFYNSYLNVIMLIGDYDYVKSSGVASGQSNYFTNYAWYSVSNYTEDENTYSIVDASYDDTLNYVWGDYLRQINIWGVGVDTNVFNSSYTSTINDTIMPSATIKGIIGEEQVNFYWNAYNYSDVVFNSLRLDNILFGAIANTTSERPKEVSPISISSETAFYGGVGDVIEVTSRVTYNNNSTFVFRPGITEVVSVKGMTWSTWSTSWSSSISDLSYEVRWYMGGNSQFGNIFMGIAATSATFTNSNDFDITLTITGGTVTSNIYAGASGMNVTSSGTRVINIIGDSDDTSTVVNPNIASEIYGGGEYGTFTGDTYINIVSASNIKSSVYGGGQYFTSTVYGNTYVTVVNSTINGNLYGGGYNGNIEDNDSSTGGNVNLVVYNSNITGNIYGVAIGGTQTLTSDVSIGDTDNWQGTQYYPADSAWTSVKTSYYGDYTSDWSWNLPASGFPFIVLDESTGEYGYVCTNVLKSMAWTSSSSNRLSYYYTRTFAYLSLGYVRNDVNISIEGSTIGTDSNGLGNVYGGGSVAVVYGDVYIDIDDSTIYGNIYGGGDGTATPSTVTLYSPRDSEDYVAPMYTENADGSVSVTSENVDSSLSLGEFTWTNSADVLALGGIDYDKRLIYSKNVDGLGSVNGDINISVTNTSVKNNIYGGGNAGESYGSTCLEISKSTIDGSVFGGGNSASVYGNTNVSLRNSTTLGGSLYGGGNAGTVEGSTSVEVSESTINGSLYGGGNSADVLSNSIVTLDGNSIVVGSVFGGGNSGNIGSDGNTSTVNIISAFINGNIYGGGNTSKVYGSTIVNIGKNTIDSTSTYASLTILGNIFGGGEANASGSTDYDFSYISVTEGVTINIDGSGYDTFVIGESIFGSGNASSSEGISTITIKNYGSSSNVAENVSIQRATTVILDNSYILLEGVIDSTNKFGSELFSISRVDEFIIKNGSSVYLCNGTNLLKSWVSLDSNGDKATTSVDNRIYIYEGKSAKITTSEDNSSFGTVTGITLMGIFKIDGDEIIRGIYDFDNPEEVEFEDGVYILGAISSDIYTDGFYSLYDITGDLEIVIPATSGLSHVWQLGATSKTVDITLTASVYDTIGKYNLTELFASEGNTEYSISSINIDNLSSGVELINSSSIPKVYDDNTDANKYIGIDVSLYTNDGWNDDYTFSIVSNSSTYYEGDSSFVTSYNTTTPVLEISLTNAANFDRTDNYGVISIVLIGTKQVDELTWKNYKITINITITTQEVEMDNYSANITYGSKYEIFGTNTTVISSNSSFSVNYSLFSDSDMYDGYSDYERILVSDYVLPENTKLTLIDLENNKYYYYQVSNDDILASKVEYKFSDFYEMGNVDGTLKYNDDTNYYSNGYYYENFIIIVDFEDTTTNTYDTQHYLQLEVRDNYNTIYTINNETINSIVYTVEDGSYTFSLSDTTLKNSTIDSLDNLKLDVVANLSSETFIDTTLMGKKLVLKVSIYKDETQLDFNDLLGKTITTEDGVYYADSYGNYYVIINNNVVDTYKEIYLDVSNNSLDSGEYTIKLELLSSYGIKVNTTTLISEEYLFNVSDEESNYGFDVNIDNESRVVNYSTGKDLNGNNTITYDIIYHGNLSNPSVTFTLYKKGDDEYEVFDVSNITSNSWVSFNEYEYLIYDTLNDSNSFDLTFNTNLEVGSYIAVFTLYNEGEYITQKDIQFIISDY